MKTRSPLRYSRKELFRVSYFKFIFKKCVLRKRQTSRATRALDERFVSGTVAFFSSAMQDGVYFDKLKIEAQPCQTPQVSPPPLPPVCSVFVESYFSSVSALYAIVDGADKGGSVGHWEYRVSKWSRSCSCKPQRPTVRTQDGVRGRNKVLVQLNAVRGPADVGTIAVLKGQRTCKHFFSLNFKEGNS